jgi:uncharacterized phage protein (TIGR02218 family)
MSSYRNLYCIKLELQEKTIYITNNKEDLIVEGVKYLSSNIEISEIISNDFGKNNISVKGLYDANFVYNDVLSKMNFTVFFVENDLRLKKLGEYFCEKVKKDNLQYFIELKCKTHILEKSFLPVYSKKCRAEFGDAKCGQNIENFTKRYRIVSTNSNVIKLENILEENQFYKNGYLIIKKSGKSFKSKIISQINNILTIDAFVPEFFMDSEIATIVAGCDKKISTCCKKFDNVLNFRGEPFVSGSIKSIYKFINSIKNEK